MGNESANTRSIGDLRPAVKTKPRSPCLTGTIKLQPRLIKQIVCQFQENDGEEVKANLAAWVNVDREGNQYLTVEVSPKFRAYRYENDRPDLGVLLSKLGADN